MELSPGIRVRELAVFPELRFDRTAIPEHPWHNLHRNHCALSVQMMITDDQ